jgi:hypothetical protein
MSGQNLIVNSKTYNIDYKDLKLNSSMVETVLGYKEGDDRELVTSLIEEILTESQAISNIKAEFRIFDNVLFDTETKSVTINDIRLQVNKIIFNQLKKSDSVALFLCTAGAEISLRSKEAMKERDFLKGYIYDIVGSEIVEAAADIMQDDLEKMILEKGKKITNRYSPGYCGWDVVEQNKLFQLFPGNYCGIQLTQSALMVPVKSVSGIIGIGKEVKNQGYTCKMCGLKDCVYRRAREIKS